MYKAKGTGACWFSENNKLIIVILLLINMEEVKAPWKTLNATNCCSLHEKSYFFSGL